MSVTEILQLMDQLVSKHTGNPLDDLQKRAILGILQHQTYSDIAEGINYDEEYIGKISRELYGIVSQELKDLGQETDVKKSNFATSIERLINSNNYYFLQHINNNHGNLCLNNTQNQPQDSNNNVNSANRCYHDLTFAPQILKFYNRETELKTLSNLIFNQKIKLISVLGLSGIGKTYLVKKFVDLNLEQFEVIIWKNLNLTPSLNQIITEILTAVETSEVFKTSEVCQFLNLLKEKRCLIILDDVQNIFITGQFAGQYQTEYKDYQKFFTMITETNHQSNIILISQEQCPEMECLDEDLYPVKCLELSGLDDLNILNGMGLKNNSTMVRLGSPTALTNHENSWLDLINLYEGNLMYLKTIATLINKNYDGQVSEFLAENTLHITPKMQSYFRELFNHLSPIEQKIVLQLSKFNQAIDREELRQSLSLNYVDFHNGLQSLQQRYLVRKIKGDKIMFKISIVFREYVKNFCQD